jgi:hypothetical protein
LKPVNTPFFGAGRTHFRLGLDTALLPLKQPRLLFFRRQDPFLLGSRLGPTTFRVGQDPSPLGLAGPNLLGSRLGPAIFGVDQDPFPLGGKTYFLLGSKLGPATFEAGQNPFPLGGRTRFFFFFAWVQTWPSAFGAGQNPFLWAAGLVFLLGSRFDPAAFGAGQDPFPLGLDTT